MRRKYLMRILFETDLILWAVSWQNQQNGMCTQRDSDQPGHSPSLISGIRPVWSVFPVRMKKAWVLSYPLSAQQRLWSDWADAQADLIFWFCHDAAHILSLKRLYVSWHSISAVSHMVEPPLQLWEDEGGQGGGCKSLVMIYHIYSYKCHLSLIIGPYFLKVRGKWPNYTIIGFQTPEFLKFGQILSQERRC